MDNITPPKPLSKDDLIRLVDDNYDDICKATGVQFPERSHNERLASMVMLSDFKDKRVLQRILSSHIMNGASYAHDSETIQALRVMKEVTMSDQINAAIVKTALLAENFKGDRKEAAKFLGTGITG